MSVFLLLFHQAVRMCAKLRKDGVTVVGISFLACPPGYSSLQQYCARVHVIVDVCPYGHKKHSSVPCHLKLSTESFLQPAFLYMQLNESGPFLQFQHCSADIQ